MQIVNDEKIQFQFNQVSARLGYCFGIELKSGPNSLNFTFTNLLLSPTVTQCIFMFQHN